MSVIIIICIINIPGLFYYLNKETIINPLTNQTNSVNLSCTSSSFVSFLTNLIYILSRLVIQFLIKLILTMILIYKLSKLKINVTTLSLKREYVFTFTIAILNMISIVSDVFVLITSIFNKIYGYNQTYISLTSNQSAIASFVYICSVVSSLFFLVDFLFVVNVITNRSFRKEARKLFKCHHNKDHTDLNF